MATSSSATRLRRLSILHRHLDTGSSPPFRALEIFTLSGETAPDFSGGPGTLTVVDNRTGNKYEFKISKGSTVKATDFTKVNENKI